MKVDTQLVGVCEFSSHIHILHDTQLAGGEGEEGREEEEEDEEDEEDEEEEEEEEEEEGSKLVSSVFV